MGKRIQKNAARPRWGWSGVREIVRPLWSERELRRVAGLLPRRRSSIDHIVAELHAIGDRYHRNLHQDEFGPTRAERMQALRDLVARLDVLSSRLEALPPQLRLLLSDGLLQCRPGRSDVDPVAFYSADKTAVDVMSETASDVRHTLVSVGRTDEADLIGEVCAAADAIAPLLWNLDATTGRAIFGQSGQQRSLIQSSQSGNRRLFSIRRFGVKHFQAFNAVLMYVSRGSSLLSGISALALPIWDQEDEAAQSDSRSDRA